MLFHERGYSGPESAGVRKADSYQKDEEDLDEFDDYLMDRATPAQQVHLLLYRPTSAERQEVAAFKDDDARMSFLLGNYITLTTEARH